MIVEQRQLGEIGGPSVYFNKVRFAFRNRQAVYAPSANCMAIRRYMRVERAMHATRQFPFSRVAARAKGGVCPLRPFNPTAAEKFARRPREK